MQKYQHGKIFWRVLDSLLDVVGDVNVKTIYWYSKSLVKLRCISGSIINTINLIKPEPRILKI